MEIRRGSDAGKGLGHGSDERNDEVLSVFERTTDPGSAAPAVPRALLTAFNIVGKSALIEHVRSSIDVQSQYDAPVLITGETGTGKELAARGLHYGGSRAGHPFVPVNCATLTDELFASEVFGHVKGAFTDARQDKQGLLAAADCGTLFLDEVDSLSLKSQAALLRLLQEGEYRPVGSQKTLQSNVRLIASANCDLEERIRAGTFRQDLYYRLYILSVHMPPLRQRIVDIPLLVQHFLDSFHSQYRLGRKLPTPGLLRNLQARPWPGNVRELENMIHRLYLVTKGDSIGEEVLALQKGRDESVISLPAVSVPPALPQRPDNLAEATPGADFDFSRDKREAVEQFERLYVKRLLQHCGGNVTKAASLCGKERRAFGKLVKKYRITKVDPV